MRKAKQVVKCRGGCGKTKDVAELMRLGDRIGFKKVPTWTCADCYKKEERRRD